MSLKAKRNKLSINTNYLLTSPENKTQLMNDKKAVTTTKVGTRPPDLLKKGPQMAVISPLADKKYFCNDDRHSAQFQRYGIGHKAGMKANYNDKDHFCHRSSRSTKGGRAHKEDQLILFPNQYQVDGADLTLCDGKKKVNVIKLRLNDVQLKSNIDGLKLPQQRHNNIKSKTRATQTLFRESSAQTLPYLPEVSNDARELKNLEIFRLPTILPGDGPPGVYEVEVLERARKRWAFAKALKDNFRQQLETARGHVRYQDDEQILEAFEWEQWIAREENIQECQMLRLQLLIRMFDEREREMHASSKNRVERSFQHIEAKRKAALKKNELDYNRAIRRLEITHSKQPRVWRRESIIQELGDPSSEFYAPKIRYGTNPSRRHYDASRTGFDMRMGNLEEKAMAPKALECPFAKLRKWSKPKEVLREVEQNFCTDKNLTRLYHNLRTLREAFEKRKYSPFCLKAKDPKKDTGEKVTIQEKIPGDTTGMSREHSLETSEIIESFEELRNQKLSMELISQEMRNEELEALINAYEGNTIGWLMRFLSEEMCRLKEQRKLQFFTMMAKRQRWQREAAEAGLRQKEDYIRDKYEQLYREFDEINKNVTGTFLQSILNTGIENYAHQRAEEDIVAEAKDLDKEISDWIESFEEIQNPLNYHTLRHALKEIVIPDVEKILHRLERDKSINYIINVVVLGKVFIDLESHDVSFSITKNFADNLLDNDLYLNSSDCSSNCECQDFCSCNKLQMGTNSIINKIIRYAVPEKSCCKEVEHIITENIRDLLDDILNKVIPRNNIVDVHMPSSPNIVSQGGHTDLIRYTNDLTFLDTDDEQPSNERFDKIKFNILNPDYKTTATDVTKSLKWSEDLLLVDPDTLSNDAFLINRNEYILPESKYELSIVHNVPSMLDFSAGSEFNTTPVYAQTSSEEPLESLQFEQEQYEEKRSETHYVEEEETEQDDS